MRIITALLTYVLLASALPGASATAAASSADPVAERAQRARISIAASPEWVKKGGIVKLTGRVRGVRGRAAVTIYQKNKGARKWVVEAKKRTTRKGRFTHREDVNSGDRTYKACVKRACDTVLVHMGKAPSKPTAVSISAISASSIEAGQPFTVSGAASANLNGRQVEVQAYDSGSGSWGAVGRGSVQNNAWSASTSVSTAGRSVPLRAAFLGGVGLSASRSTASSVSVYGWYYFYDGTPAYVAQREAYGGQVAYDTWNINGVTYSKSLGIGGGTGYSNWVEYDLARSCIRLATTVGLDDSSGTTTRATARIVVDNVTKWTQSGLQLGQSIPVTIDITSGLRLHVETSETTSGTGDVVFGDVRTLCAF